MFEIGDIVLLVSSAKIGVVHKLDPDMLVITSDKTIKIDNINDVDLLVTYKTMLQQFKRGILKCC